MDSEDFIINEIVFSTRFALSLNKISRTSAIKMKVFAFSFCIALGFDKILTLGNMNKFPFLSLNRIFALSLDKISGTSG